MRKVNIAINFERLHSQKFIPTKLIYLCESLLQYVNSCKKMIKCAIYESLWKITWRPAQFTKISSFKVQYIGLTILLLCTPNILGSFGIPFSINLVNIWVIYFIFGHFNVMDIEELIILSRSQCEI